MSIPNDRKTSDVLPTLIQVKADGLVTDEQGGPIPLSDVKAILAAVAARYETVTPEELHERRLEWLRRHFPGMLPQYTGTPEDMA